MHGLTSYQTPSANYPGIRGVSMRDGAITVPYDSRSNLPYPPYHSQDVHRHQQSYRDYNGDITREAVLSGIQQPSLSRYTVNPPRAETPTTHVKRTSTYSSAIPSGLTNSNRATMSQIKARIRIKQNQQKVAIEENAPRKVLNYSKGDNDDVRGGRD